MERAEEGWRNKERGEGSRDDEMVKGKVGWSGKKLGIGRREGEVERKGFEGRTE